MTNVVYAADLCSAALVRLGDRPLSALDEETDRARLCRHLYPVTRDALLRDHPWSCAVRRAVLDPSGEAPAFGFARRFWLPPDFLRLLGLGGAGLAYSIEGRSILAQAERLPIRYVAGGDAVDESAWDAGFRHALTLALAQALAYPVTQSAALRESFAGELREVLRRARAVNGSEVPSAEIEADSGLLAAHGGQGRALAWWERNWLIQPEAK